MAIKNVGDLVNYWSQYNPDLPVRSCSVSTLQLSWPYRLVKRVSWIKPVYYEQVHTIAASTVGELVKELNKASATTLVYHWNVKL